MFSFDLALDFENDKNIGSSQKRHFAKAVRKFGTNIITKKSTIYANLCNSKFHGLYKICLYDKFKKQVFYQGQKLPESLSNWKRLELVFKIKEKFLDKIENSFFEFVEIMDEIINNYCASFPFGLDTTLFENQLMFFKDNRKKLRINNE